MMSDRIHFSSPCITRRRYIPDEITPLSKDHIYQVSQTCILTAWDSINPRADLAGGISVYYPERGFKISKIHDSRHQLVHWYCDIIRFHYYSSSFPQYPLYYEDLLLDVVLKNDGQVRILDADELADALEQGLIDQETACLALRRLHDLLSCIYSGDFSTLQRPVLELEERIYPHKVNPLPPEHNQ